MTEETLNDGLLNVVSSMGTPRDKAAGSAYADVFPDASAYINAYRGDAMVRKVVDIPAFDACRMWRAWQASKEQISAIEAVEKSLALQTKVMRAMILGRLLGGGALLIGVKNQALHTKMRVEAVGKGDLKYITVLSRQQLTASEIQRDPRQDDFGEPVMYGINLNDGNQLKVHPSRLALFRGNRMEGVEQAGGNDGWGDSVLTSTLDHIMRLVAASNNVGSLIFEAKIDVVRIKNMSKNLAADTSGKYEKALLKRWQIAAMGKGINGTMIMDAEEEYDQKTMSFSTLPEVLDRFAQLVSAAADIPITRFMGQSASGLNNTGETDIRNYYDRIAAHQTLEIEPTTQILDECLIRSALGSRPSPLHYNWRPLWQMSDRERFDVGNKASMVVSKLHKTGIIPSEPLAEAAVNLMTEIGVLPGLEEAVGDQKLGNLGPMKPAPPTPNVPPKPIGDAVPRTLYVSRKLLNVADVLKWAKDQGIATVLDDLHVTVAYSRAPIDWMKVDAAWEDTITVGPGGPRVMEKFGKSNDVLVLSFASSALSWRHKELEAIGASWDYDKYQPHLTITYDGADVDLDDIEPYQGPLEFGPEIFSEVDEDYKEKLNEV